MNDGKDSKGAGREEAPDAASGPPRSFLCPHCGKSHPIFMARCPDEGQPVDRVYKMQGQLLEGKYRVGRMVAQGGMGVVYEGTHTKIGRRLAVKFLMGFALSNRELVARFQNEARIAASIGHRNIVDILDMGNTSSGQPYIVMEFLEGRDLGTVLDAVVRLPQPLAVEICIQILGGLRSVHEREIVHRDLKPENVFVLREVDGGITVKLVDFGISRLAPARKKDLSLTRTGAVFGTPRYMAPEQARGKKDVDHRADLYSVGVILYELLTGALPFEADDYNNMIIAITTEDPLRVSQHGVLIDDSLAEIVMKAICRNPDDRYQSADEFIHDLLPRRAAEIGSVDISGVLRLSDTGGREATEGSGVSVDLPGGSSVKDAPSLRSPTVSPEEQGQTHSMRPWEGSVPEVEPGPAGRRRGWGRTALTITVIPLMILAAAGLAALLVLHFVDLGGGRAGPSGDSTKSTAGPAPPPQEKTPVWNVELSGIPDDAQVQVDGTLHPERPVNVEDRPGARRVTVTAPDHEPWEKEVAIHGDVTLRISLTPIVEQTDEEPEPQPVVKKKGKGAKKKDGSGKDGKKGKKDGEKGSKIDTVYPGLR